MKSELFLALGLAGSLLVVGAYLLNQLGRLASSDWRFPAANLVGALAILLSLTDAWNLPAAMIEVFWAAISLFGLVRAFRQA
ncbi:MAG TPA: hypothetical protein VFS01_09345 [Rhizomicrobium sp.]|nr:hypothetical protein [Rhizomicrobium sp.]